MSYEDYKLKFTNTLTPGKPLSDYTEEEQAEMLCAELKYSVDQTLADNANLEPQEPAPSPFVTDMLALIRNWKSYKTHLIVTRYLDGKVTYEFYQSKEDPRASIHTSNPPEGV
jgi:hypothetical protein